jgi:phosphatidylinositol glycan class Q protein
MTTAGVACGLWDAFRCATLHISLMAQFAGRLHRWAGRYLAATWRFFIGKKWNVLRRRLDSSDLALDQLLLNSVFFTTLLFLFPTVLAYYLFFAMVCTTYVAPAPLLLDR